MTPGWILDAFAALMVAVAALSASRLAVARSRRGGAAAADVDVAHLLMGIAMAGVLAARLATFPDRIWAACFAAATAWFGYRAVRHARANGTRAVAGGQYAPHLAHSAAMLYVFLALATAAGGGMGGRPGSAPQPLSLPALGFAFALALIGYSVWDLDQLSGRRYAFAVVAGAVPGAAGASARARTGGGAHAKARYGATAVLVSPAVTVGCRIALGITMAFLLFLMI